MTLSLTGNALYQSVYNALNLITPGSGTTDPIEFWLAFLLILAIINTVLKNVNFFKENQNKGARAIVSLVVAYFAVTVIWVSPVLVYLSSTLAVVAVALVAILIIAALLGTDIQSSSYQKYLFGIAIAVLILGGVFANAIAPAAGLGGSGGGGSVSSGSASYVGQILSAIGTQGILELIVLVVFIGGIAYMIGGGSGGGNAGRGGAGGGAAGRP